MTMRNKEKREQSEARQKEEEEEEVSKRDHIACMLLPWLAKHFVFRVSLSAMPANWAGLSYHLRE